MWLVNCLSKPVSVGVRVGVIVSVGVRVGVIVSVGVRVGVIVSVGVRVGVIVSVGFRVVVTVSVGVIVSVGFGVVVTVSVPAVSLFIASLDSCPLIYQLTIRVRKCNICYLEFEKIVRAKITFQSIETDGVISLITLKLSYKCISRTLSLHNNYLCKDKRRTKQLLFLP